MIDRLKELLAEYKVTVSFVAGALVVGTAWGSCSFEPRTEVVSATTVESAEEIVVDQNTAETQEVANTNENTATVNENTSTDSNMQNGENTETPTDAVQ
tara:strand:- start:2132 stop:2428 length:297 start_codon:yes stop_codon:yes gene_type:complete